MARRRGWRPPWRCPCTATWSTWTWPSTAAARPLVDPKWKMAPGEASHRWQFYGAEGTFALLEKDDLDYGVIGNPTKATKEKGDKLLVEPLWRATVS